MIFRSEAKQLIGYELLKALNNFKQSMVVHLSSSNQQNKSNKSLEKKIVGMLSEDNRSHSRKEKNKVKSQKSTSRFKIC
jgi:hypothetical protein